MIYLDNNATTRPAPEVVAAMIPYLADLYANPSSAHGAGMAVKQALGQARGSVAGLIGAKPAEITFTATSADVLHGFHVEGTRLNMMLIPGQVSRNTYTFQQPGEYVIICHEYCGLGHHTMFGKVVVE